MDWCRGGDVPGGGLLCTPCRPHTHPHLSCSYGPISSEPITATFEMSLQFPCLRGLSPQPLLSGLTQAPRVALGPNSYAPFGFSKFSVPLFGYLRTSYGIPGSHSKFSPTAWTPSSCSQILANSPTHFLSCCSRALLTADREHREA